MARTMRRPRERVGGDVVMDAPVGRGDMMLPGPTTLRIKRGSLARTDETRNAGPRASSRQLTQDLLGRHMMAAY